MPYKTKTNQTISCKTKPNMTIMAITQSFLKVEAPFLHCTTWIDNTHILYHVNQIKPNQTKPNYIAVGNKKQVDFEVDFAKNK